MPINHYLDGTGAYGGRGEPIWPQSIPSKFGKALNQGHQLLIHLLNRNQGRGADGRAIEGLQPWHVSGYKKIASGSVIAAKSDIADMFASAQTVQFTTDDTFPWTFAAMTFRCSITANPQDPAVEDAAWMRQLFLRFVVATEVGRLSLPSLGCDFIIQQQIQAAGGGDKKGIACQMNMIDIGVPWRVVFEKNGNYQMFLSTDFGITLTGNVVFTYQMDGWVVQNQGILSDGKMLAAVLGQLIGTSPEQVRRLLGSGEAPSAQLRQLIGNRPTNITATLR